MKRNDGEPTYTLVLGSCPEAVKNPDTDEPVDKKRVYDVFRTQCYDDGADQPWKHQKRLTKTALPDDVIEKRLEWQFESVRVRTNPAQPNRSQTNSKLVLVRSTAW